MAANIQTRDIQQGTFQAWHGLTKLEKSITKENIVFNRYSLLELPLTYNHNGKEMKTDSRQIVASDDGLPIGKPISDTYSVISNMEIFDMAMESMAGMKHKLVSVGTIADRAKGFMSFELDKEFMAGQRKTNSVLSLLWGHGNGLPVIGKSNFTVIVCQNTFNASMNQKGDFTFRVSHHKFAAKKIDNMGEAIEAHFGVQAEFQAAMDEFSSINCSQSKAERIYTGFIGEGNDKLSTRSKNQIDRLVTLFNTGKGNRGETFADLFNGVTDYYSHESSGGEKNRWKQFESSEFGSGNRAKVEFFELIQNKDRLKETEKAGERLLLVK